MLADPFPLDRWTDGRRLNGNRIVTGNWSMGREGESVWTGVVER